MCRVWAHLGDPLLIDEPLFGAANSLIAQSVSPSLMSLLNIGGFGLLAWDPGRARRSEPYAYRTPNVPVFDRNLKALAAKVHANAAVAHVRGVVYDPTERVGAAEPAPVPVRRRARGAGAKRRPVRVQHDALRPARAPAPRAGRADRGDDRHGVGLRAGAVAARRPVRAGGRRRARRRGDEGARHPARGPRPARHRGPVAGQPRRDRRLARWSRRASRSTTAGTPTTSRSSPASASSTSRRCGRPSRPTGAP